MATSSTTTPAKANASPSAATTPAAAPAATDPALPPTARAGFVEHTMKGEPPGDRKLTLDDGTELRERLSKSGTAENVESSAERVAATGFAVKISNALLDANGAVARDASGALLIAPAHELTLTGDALARLGTEAAVAAAVEAARQEAAALAKAHFAGLALGEKVLGSRL